MHYDYHLLPPITILHPILIITKIKLLISLWGSQCRFWRLTHRSYYYRNQEVHQSRVYLKNLNGLTPMFYAIQLSFKKHLFYNQATAIQSFGPIKFVLNVFRHA